MKKTIISIIVIVLFVIGLSLLIRENSRAQVSSGVGQELIVEIIQQGEGNIVLEPGMTAVVHYTGTLIDGIVFDSSLTRSQPFEFQFGTGTVIAGWDQGLQGMRVGEKRRLIVPASLAYGNVQVGPIPPNSILIFEVELLEIR